MPDPEKAYLSKAMKSAVAAAAALLPTAVISGRDRRFIEERVGLENVAYAGSHGFDIKTADGVSFVHSAAESCVEIFDRLEPNLRGQLSKIPGVMFERKQFSLAVHYRNVSESDQESVRKAVEEVPGREKRLKAAPGKKVVELLPAVEWNKGRAVSWLMEALSLSSALPIYLGDDVTDEDAFRAVAADGIGVRITEDSQQPSAARFVLRNQTEVMGFLEKLVDYRRASPASRL